MVERFDTLADIIQLFWLPDGYAALFGVDFHRRFGECLATTTLCVGLCDYCDDVKITLDESLEAIEAKIFSPK